MEINTRIKDDQRYLGWNKKYVIGRTDSALYRPLLITLDFFIYGQNGLYVVLLHGTLLINCVRLELLEVVQLYRMGMKGLFISVKTFVNS